MKPKRLSSLLSLCLAAVLLLSGCAEKAAPPPAETDAPPEPVQTAPAPEPAVSPEDAIRPLEVRRYLLTPQGVDGVGPYREYYHFRSRLVSGDLSGDPALAYSLTFGNLTEFAGELPQGYDPQALLEWGKAPGLNVDVLHEHGFTGKGAVVAYVDQPIGEHEQFEGMALHYTDPGGSDASMHGSAVLSLLAGKDTGTAPEAEVYYYAYTGLDETHESRADCLYQIIEKNKSLPEGEKITMVGCSFNLNPYADKELKEAVAACGEAGIMVWFCAEYKPGAFLPFSDKNDPRSIVIDKWGLDTGGGGELVYVPDAGRTTAGDDGADHYTFWAFNGGLSWTMPYMLGLYAIANEIDPSLTQDGLRELVVDTAYHETGLPVINPVGFIAAVLDGADRGAEAEALRQDAASRERYLYAVLDPTAMSEADLTAIGGYLAAVTSAQVLAVDARAFSGAEDLSAALQADAAQRGGTIAGVQLFGPLDWDLEQLPQPTAHLSLAEGGYQNFFTQYKAGTAEDAVFPPNPAWALFNSSAQIPLG